ncbi:MAG: hypothetical protein DRJ97_06580, partial [Thermoprotei archaeon]
LLKDSMKCLAQATALLAESLDRFAQKTCSQAAALYAHHASYDLRKLNMLLRSAIEALGFNPDEPTEDCVKAAGRLMIESLNEALRILGSEKPDLPSLIDAGRRLVEAAMVHALAYTKAFTMLNPGYEHLAIASEAAAKDLHNHLEILEKLKPVIMRELSASV